MLETEICAAVLRLFESQGATVYQEVSWGAYGSGHCADLVAKLPDGSLHLVEAERHASLSLLGTADWWRHCNAARFVSLAAKCPRGTAYQGLNAACRSLGLGFIAVDPAGVAHELVKPLASPGEQRISDCLYDGQINGLAAGSAAGSRWTTFRETCNNLIVYLGTQSDRRSRAVSAAKAIAHHYASDRGAASTLLSVVRRKLVPGVELVSEGRATYLALTQAEETR